MSVRCSAFTNKGYQCANNSAHGYLTCNIKSHIEQLYDTKQSNFQSGGGWGQSIEPIYSLKKNNKKFVQMGGSWGDKKASFFGLFNN
jgi:predicted KAP-like P-loop ATPase